MEDKSRDPVLLGAAWVAGIAAAVASWSALYGLALRTGWSHWTAPLFPLTVDAYAVAAIRVWLGSRPVTALARQRARRSAVLAIAASMAGNAALHAAAAHVYMITWPVVVAVSAVPPITLGLVSHLFALRRAPAREDQAEDTGELPGILTDAELAAMSKTDAIRVALRQTDGHVIDAVAWLADRGITVSRPFAHDVKRGASGKGRRHRAAPPELDGLKELDLLHVNGSAARS